MFLKYANYLDDGNNNPEIYWVHFSGSNPETILEKYGITRTCQYFSQQVWAMIMRFISAGFFTNISEYLQKSIKSIYSTTTNFYIFSICQSIGDMPCSCKNSLAWLKCLQPKNPLYADSGLGCGALSIRCLGLVSIGILLCAGLPQSI